VCSKLLFCGFEPKVFCSFRKSERFVVMDRCLKCKYYLEFAREQEEFEQEAFDELDRLVESEKFDG
jgi:hypothetical protein